MKEISGYYYEPFGMIFCGNGSAFYQLNINLDSQYLVVKQTVVGDGTTGEVLIPWTELKYLQAGYNLD